MCVESGVFPAVDWFNFAGVYNITRGLERKTRTLKTKKWDKVLTIEYRVDVACYWLIHTGLLILREVAKISTGWFGYNSELWDQSKGFSKERWEFWKGRLIALGNIETFSDETKELMRRAGLAMEKAERAVEKEKEKGKKAGQKS